MLVSLLIKALIASLINHTIRLLASFLLSRTRQPKRARTAVASCHEERGRGAWPVSVSLVATRTYWGELAESVAEAGREINDRRRRPSVASRGWRENWDAAGAAMRVGQNLVFGV